MYRHMNVKFRKLCRGGKSIKFPLNLTQILAVTNNWIKLWIPQDFRNLLTRLFTVILSERGFLVGA